jgi:hypothetical protein
MFFVAISLFSFLAKTHSYFQCSDGDACRLFTPEHTPTGSDVVNLTNNTSNNETTNDVTHHPSLLIIDIVCLVFFTSDYLLRFIVVSHKFKYLRSPMGIVDVIALLSDYVELILYILQPKLNLDDSTLKYVSFIRIVRILRIFRLIRHIPGLWILIYTLKASMRELLLMAVFLFVGVLVFASLIYYVDDRAVFTSIPHSFWWALITMTTVGYGDMYPVTALGYVVGSLTAMSGLLMVGFSVPVLVSNFLLYYKHVKSADSSRQTDRNVNDCSSNENSLTVCYENSVAQSSVDSEWSSIAYDAENENNVVEPPVEWCAHEYQITPTSHM